MNISVKNLTHTFNEQTLFKNLSFDIRTGRKVCILGPSGSGKSTLLKTLTGLAVPTSGQIRIGDQPLTEKSVWSLRRQIAYVAQEPDLGEGPVIDRIRQPFSYRANAELTWDHNAVSDYCRQFRLDEKLLHKDTTDLSGGEKQRIALIIALLLKRPILILDEPVSALDKETKSIVKDELQNNPTRTIIFVSHESALLEIADTIIDLNTPTGAPQ